MTKAIVVLKSEVNKLKSKLSNIMSPEEPPNEEDKEATDIFEAPMDIESDDSVLTIDENITDLNSEDPLNSPVPTIQLIQLEQ